PAGRARGRDRRLRSSLAAWRPVQRSRCATSAPQVRASPQHARPSVARGTRGLSARPSGVGCSPPTVQRRLGPSVAPTSSGFQAGRPLAATRILRVNPELIHPFIKERIVEFAHIVPSPFLIYQP